MNQPFDDGGRSTSPSLVASAAHRDARGDSKKCSTCCKTGRRARALFKLGRAATHPCQRSEKSRWKFAAKHVLVDGRKDVSMRVRLEAARKLINEMFVSDAEEQRKARAARKLKPAA
jgi:hypothetical protein